MRKFAEFTSKALIYTKSTHHRRSRYRFCNLEDALSPAQLTFLENKYYKIRPHPQNKRSGVENKFELFFDTSTLTERDDTIITLLFDNARFR
jgi:hypothetical protein